MAELDIAALSLVISGPKLVYALSKSLALPSLTAIQKHSRPPAITPCSGFPKHEEIVGNINNCFRSKSYGKPWGFEVMMDELSLEERPRYHYATNAVLGICREHGGAFDLEVSSMDPLDVLAEGLRNKEVHYSKESTVIAIAPLTGEDYGPLIIMISGTCKTETDLRQREWIELIESGWREAEHGEICHGDIWTFSSDGDATRHRAMHRNFMSKDLTQSSPIHCLLSPLKFMNLQVGANSVTSNFDTKHIFKRYATLIRGMEGILLSHSHIQCTEIKRYLHSHPRFEDSSSTVTSLFDGKDHQNVPKAVRLLASVSLLREIPRFEEKPEARPLILLGQLLDSILLPFITPELSLSDQLIHLSTASHLILALYRLNGNAFMPGQLYYDTQACIKNIYFCVAKQKVLDSSEKFFIGLCGTDRLEGEFGQIRSTRGGSNVDILQLTDRAASAAQMSEIYAKHPSWNRGHCRLSLTGKEGIDHTNLKSWIGDMTVANVSLLTCWNAGRQKAETFLRAAGTVAPFTQLQNDGSVDMMRPRGSYVGLRDDEPDRYQDTLSPIDEEIEIQTSPDAMETEVESTEDSFPCELDDLLPDPALEPTTGGGDVDNVFKKDNTWMKVGGRSIHKASAVRIALSEDNVQKSRDRLRRVRGYSRDPAKPTLNDDSIFGGALIVGRLVATFLRIDNTAALAILCTTAFFNAAGIAVSFLKPDELTDPSVKVKAQVMELKQSSDLQWQWTGAWESLSPVQAKTGKAAEAVQAKGLKQELILTVPAPLVQAIDGELVVSDAIFSLESDDSNKKALTWAFSHIALASLSAALWEAIRKDKEKIPSRKPSTTFPYRSQDGMLI